MSRLSRHDSLMLFTSLSFGKSPVLYLHSSVSHLCQLSCDSVGRRQASSAVSERSRPKECTARSILSPLLSAIQIRRGYVSRQALTLLPHLAQSRCRRTRPLHQSDNIRKTRDVALKSELGHSGQQVLFFHFVTQYPGGQSPK